MNLPNSITMGRFVLALVLFGYLVHTDVCSGPSWVPAVLAGSLFIVVVITDALDGYYARKLDQQTAFGRIADPVVDKILVCGAFIFLVQASWARAFHPQLTWIVVVLVGREFMVSGLRGFIEARGVGFPARWDGKLKMVLQCIAVPAILAQRAVDLSYPGERWLVLTFDVIAWTSLWSMFAGTLTSGARYVGAAARVLRGDGGATA